MKTILWILLILVLAALIAVEVSAKVPPSDGRGEAIWQSGTRICWNNLYPAEKDFMCGVAPSHVSAPWDTEWSAHVADELPDKISFVVFWSPRFLGWTLLVFAPDDGCMTFANLNAYCIKYSDDRRSFEAWSHPALPRVMGYQVLFEPVYPQFPYTATYSVYVPLLTN